ncbi:TonB-dependent receptor [Flavivirga sp. 57AJ16]|uniref:TonB-dependent receptor n=1 Tax=Flavivirga sp. 57AJ16 TaxID=3025307 RepID=UPI0023652E97|nr:TonB-dependent receptor [Flavivirga sp. 57AJ16]MDD7887727.1 TonB-dependent receptor [Flavivirga sp. 57AJ16]
MKKILGLKRIISYPLNFELKMKLTTLFLLISLFQLQAKESYAQKTKITLNLENVSIEKVLNEIESKTDFKFIYDYDYVNHKKIVSINANNEKLSSVLERLFKGTNILYKTVKKQIILKQNENPFPKENKPTNENKPPQQDLIVEGVITDTEGVLLPGASILEKGTKNGTQTDFDGRFSLKLFNDDAILVISYIGYKTKEISVKNQSSLTIVLEIDTANLDEIVIVGFGTQKKRNLVGSVQSISPSEIRIPSSNLTTALAGRLSGLISYQRTGEPGADNAEFFIRGVTTFGYKKDPLILIDGVELSVDDLSRLQVEDIASFSILKDATATAIYGARGANGIILVTTKSGVAGKVKVSVRYENSISSATRNIDFADPITYMRLHNEAVRTRNALPGNSFLPLPYTEKKIQNTIAGTNSMVYPAIDWQEELLKDYTQNQRVNLNLNGGGDKVRYYLSLSYTNDTGLLKVDKRNNFNNNINLNKLSVRSNINIDLTPTTEVILRFNGAYDDYTGPLFGGADIYTRIRETNPVLFPKYFEPDEANLETNHILFGNAGDGNYLNPYSDLVRGYRQYSKTILLSQFEVKQDLSMITDGLKGRMLLNTTRNSDFDVNRQYNPYFYRINFYNEDTNEYTLAPLNIEDGTEYLSYGENAPNVSTSFDFVGTIDYNRTFNEKHEIAGLLALNARSSLRNNTGSLQNSLPYRNLGVSGRFSYAFNRKYFVEFNFGYNGSERFDKNHRFGFFPSAGIGWTISEEPFFKSLKPTISYLKARLTYGEVGNDAIGDINDRFFYLSRVNVDNGGRGYTFGTDLDYFRPGVSIDRYENSLITWELAKKTNLGLELNLFNDKVKILADVFSEQRENILMDRAYIPPSLGLEAAVRANVGKAESEGIDFSIDYNQDFGNSLWFSSRINFTYATGKFKVYEEPDYSDMPWLQRAGQSINQQWGYIAERLFVDEAEALNSPQQFGIYGAGDIKYKDINEDGIIDFRDQVPIGYPTVPEIVYGAGFSMGYKNFDLSAFFQGADRVSFWIDSNATSPFAGEENVRNNALLNAYANSHWSEADQDVYALWPRLSPQAVENNTVRSTWFMRNGAFLRLKQVELGFSLPRELIVDRWGMQRFRIYFSGTNLFSLSRFKLWDTEMGGNGLGYPTQKVYNIGLQVSL